MMADVSEVNVLYPRVFHLPGRGWVTAFDPPDAEGKVVPVDALVIEKVDGEWPVIAMMAAAQRFAMRRLDELQNATGLYLTGSMVSEASSSVGTPEGLRFILDALAASEGGG